MNIRNGPWLPIALFLVSLTLCLLGLFDVWPFWTSLVAIVLLGVAVHLWWVIPHRRQYLVAGGVYDGMTKQDFEEAYNAPQAQRLRQRIAGLQPDPEHPDER